MFEIIGIVSLFAVVSFLLFIQYSLVGAGVMKESLKWYGKVISWIPLLPFIIFILFFLNFMVMIVLNKLVKWFELNWGWFFINGRNQAVWAEYLRKKYGEE
jgi:hypothetical protein